MVYQSKREQGSASAPATALSGEKAPATASRSDCAGPAAAPETALPPRTLHPNTHTWVQMVAVHFQSCPLTVLRYTFVHCAPHAAAAPRYRILYGSRSTAAANSQVSQVAGYIATGRGQWRAIAAGRGGQRSQPLQATCRKPNGASPNQARHCGSVSAHGCT